jgi:hypothetical protein
MSENRFDTSPTGCHYLLVPPVLIWKPPALSLEIRCICGCRCTGSGTALQDAANALLSKVVVHFRDEQDLFCTKEFAIDLWKYVDILKKELAILAETCDWQTWAQNAQPSYSREIEMMK